MPGRSHTSCRPFGGGLFSEGNGLGAQGLAPLTGRGGESSPEFFQPGTDCPLKRVVGLASLGRGH